MVTADLTSLMIVLTAISVIVPNIRTIPTLWALRNDDSPEALVVRNGLALDCVINALRGAADILNLNSGRRLGQ